MTPLEVGQRRRWQGLPTKWDIPHGAEGLEFVVTKVVLGDDYCEGEYVDNTSNITQNCYSDRDFFEQYSVVI